MRTAYKQVVVFFVCFLGIINASWASNQQERLRQLEQQGNVIIQASLAKAGPLVPNQQVIVNVEVMTDTWFTKGTRVHRFDVHNALVMQRSSFATNSIERLNGRKYSKQVWEMVLYPLEEGRYFVPSIVVDLAVRDDKSNVTGQLVTEPFEFDVEATFSAQDEARWVVGDNLNVNQVWHHVPTNGSPQQFDDAADMEFHIGDAIERTVTLYLDNSTSSLLPRMISDEPIKHTITYTEPPELKDSQNRGVYSAKRVDKSVYVIEEAGDFTMPEISLNQWDSSGHAHHYRIASASFSVSHTPLSYIRTHWLTLSLSLLSFAGACLFILWVKNRYQQLSTNHALPIWWLFILAWLQKDQLELERLLYLKALLKRQLSLISSHDLEGDTQALVFRLQERRYKESDLESVGLLRWEWVKLWRSV
ncbi:hypothetical protein [Vibrio agarivorans]|uniref:Protein BatD n=1 Tax=Vibrio agarivorans TaxID=153622 RepID=A0ABT7XZH3_9VIBR|nr:hypothetical protein [Vibrio agarivorans]MDN2481179.1 hypothetical protein [Vibrio agarivorans]